VVSICGHQSLLLVQLLDAACVFGGLGAHVVSVRQISILEEDSIIGFNAECLSEHCRPVDLPSHLCKLVPFESLRLGNDQCIRSEAKRLSNHFKYEK